MVASAVKIPLPFGPEGGFDLAEVMAAVGEHRDLSWRLSAAEIVWHQNASGFCRNLEQQASVVSGVELTWADMERIATESFQIIDGTFTGWRGDEPVLSLAAIDSSYWIVWGIDNDIVDRVRRAFRGVEDYDAPPIR